MYAAAWCMVVDPSKITSAPSSVMASRASSVSRGNTVSSLPLSSSSMSGRIPAARTDAQWPHSR